MIIRSRCTCFLIYSLFSSFKEPFAHFIILENISISVYHSKFISLKVSARAFSCDSIGSIFILYGNIETLKFLDVKGHFKQYFSYIVAVSLLVEETVVLRENHHFAASDWQALSHNVVSSTPRHERDWKSQPLWL